MIETNDCQCITRSNAIFICHIDSDFDLVVNACIFHFDFWFLILFNIYLKVCLVTFAITCNLNRFKFNLTVNLSIIIHLKLWIQTNFLLHFYSSSSIECMFQFDWISTETVEQNVKIRSVSCFQVDRWQKWKANKKIIIMDEYGDVIQSDQYGNWLNNKFIFSHAFRSIGFFRFTFDWLFRNCHSTIESTKTNQYLLCLFLYTAQQRYITITMWRVKAS